MAVAVLLHQTLRDIQTALGVEEVIATLEEVVLLSISQALDLLQVTPQEEVLDLQASEVLLLMVLGAMQAEVAMAEQD